MVFDDPAELCSPWSTGVASHASAPWSASTRSSSVVWAEPGPHSNTASLHTVGSALPATPSPSASAAATSGGTGSNALPTAPRSRMMMSPAQASEPDAAGSQPTQLLEMPTWARRNSNPSPPRDDKVEGPQEGVQDQPQPQPPLHHQHPTGRHRRASGVLAEAAAAVAAAHTPSVAALRASVAECRSPALSRGLVAFNASRRRSMDLGYGPGGFTAPVSPALSQAGTGEPSSTSMGSHAGAAGAVGGALFQRLKSARQRRWSVDMSWAGSEPAGSTGSGVVAAAAAGSGGASAILQRKLGASRRDGSGGDRVEHEDNAAYAIPDDSDDDSDIPLINNSGCNGAAMPLAPQPATRPALRQSGCLSVRVPHSPSLQSLGGESENGSGATPLSSTAGGLPPGACSSPLTGRTTTARTITFAQEVATGDVTTGDDNSEAEPPASASPSRRLAHSPSLAARAAAAAAVLAARAAEAAALAAAAAAAAAPPDRHAPPIQAHHPLHAAAMALVRGELSRSRSLASGRPGSAMPAAMNVHPNATTATVVATTVVQSPCRPTASDVAAAKAAAEAEAAAAAAAGGSVGGGGKSSLCSLNRSHSGFDSGPQRPRGSSMSPAGSQRNFDAVVNSLWEKELEKGWQASSKHNGLLVGTRAPLRSLVAAGALGGKSFSGGSAGSLTSPPPPGAPSLAAAGMLGVAALGGPSGSATMAAREVLVGDRLAGGSAGGSSVQRPCSNRMSARSRRSLDHASPPIALAGGSNAGTPTGHNPRRSLDEGVLSPGARMSLTSAPPPPGAFAATRVAAGSPLPVHVHGPLTPTPPSSSPVLAKAAGAAGAGAAGVTAARRPAKRVGVFRRLLGVLHAVQHETAAELEEPTAQD